MVFRRFCIILLFLSICLFPKTSQAEIDEYLLRDVICHKETRVSKKPEWAVGRNGADWGECQIQYWTAIKFGKYSLERSPGELFISEVNRKTALNIIKSCIIWYPKGDIKRIAYCYNAGHYSEYASIKDSKTYAEEIDVIYKKHLSKKLPKNISLAEK